MPMALVYLMVVLTTYWGWWVIARSALLSRPREAFYNRYPPDAVRRSLLAKWNPQLADNAFFARPRHPDAPSVSWLAKMVDCPWCLGFWFAGLVVLGLDLHGSVPLPALWWPATSVGVGAVAKFLGSSVVAGRVRDLGGDKRQNDAEPAR